MSGFFYILQLSSTLAAFLFSKNQSIPAIMKKIILFALFAIISSVFQLSCSKNDFEKDLDAIRKTAWDSLSEESKSEVVIHWKEARVEQGAYLILLPDELGEQHCFRVVFMTDNYVLGGIGIFVSKNGKEVLGHVGRY